MFGGLDVAQVLVQLDLVGLLRVRQTRHGGFILDVLLDDLLLEVRGIQFHQHLAVLHIVFGHQVAFLHDPEDFRALVAHPHFAFNLL